MVLRIGHRGAAGHAPENTLPSFRKAVELGCDMTELDVHICASGEVVVIHDEKVNRTTNGKGWVSELSLTELKQLDAGNGETIPTLEEVLQLIKDQIMLNIELKGLGTAKPVYELMRKNGWGNEKLTITSFNWDMLSEYKRLDPDARIGVLTFKNHDEALRYAESIKAYSVNPYHMLLQRKYVEEAHSKGIKIYPWTPNKPNEIKNVIEKGADGVISDYPDRIL
ncbi:MAG: glycerophosphodiester phosphodiesterase family protein [Candidatus Bathyarchaeota archaeon]|nr:glycerophosphodiester phosphodiesterase family protein [Candidatus Bathyarchaeota archaeon]